jgi:hypothetical protein
MNCKYLCASKSCWVLLISLLSLALGCSDICLPVAAASGKSGLGLTLIEALQQAGRQKHGGESRRYVELAQKLVNASDMESTDSNKRTALHWCVLSAQSASNPKLREAYAGLIEEILSAGAEVNAQDSYGNTPLDYQHSGPQEIERVLIEQGGQRGYTQSAQARVLHLLDQIRMAEEENDLPRLRALLQHDLPANSVLSARLLTRVTSRDSRAGDPIELVVTAPLEVDGRVAVAAGTKIEGTVLQAQRASNKYQQARLEMDFCNLIYKSGAKSPIAALLTEVDNAREQVQEGRIIGIPFPHTFAERLSWGFRMVGLANPLIAYAMEAASMGWQKEFHREIILEPGVDILLKILAPEKMKELSAAFPSAEVPSGLSEITQNLPLRTADPGHVASDLVNILFIGNQAQLTNAFESAGWLPAQKLSVISGLKTFSSLAEQKGYLEAPVSLLLLDGKKPDLVYQKQTNTIAKRHHIRIWKYGKSYQGRELWLGAATHDIGISVLKGGTHWIHRIDPQVDLEQAKIKNDLLFTRCVEWFSLMDRPAVPQRMMNATGDEIRTQGKLLIMSLGT